MSDTPPEAAAGRLPGRPLSGGSHLRPTPPGERGARRAGRRSLINPTDRVTPYGILLAYSVLPLQAGRGEASGSRL